MQLAEEIIRIFNFLGSLVCHQRPERTLIVGGYHLPVCARCTGTYIGLLLGYSLLVLHRKNAKGPPNLYMSLLMMLPLWVDSFGQLFGFWTSTNDLRLITGLLFGTAVAPFLVYALSLQPFRGAIPIMRKVQPENASLDDKNSWLNAKTLLLGIVLSGVLFVAIRSTAGSEFVLFYWLLSVPIIIALVLHFFILPLILLFVVIKKVLNKRSLQK